MACGVRFNIPFQSRPDLQGVKTAYFISFLPCRRPSKADPIFRGSKRGEPEGSPILFHFQSRPDLQGVKTIGPGAYCILHCASKADPIFRGSKRLRGTESQTVYRSLPKQTRSSGGQNELLIELVRRERIRLPKQTRSSGGQNCDFESDEFTNFSTFQSRPDLQGVKTGGRDHRVPPPKLLNQTRSSAGKTRTRSAAPAAQSPTETKAPHVTPRPRSRSNARRQAPPRAQASRRQNPRRPKSDSQPGPRLHAREPRPSARHMPQRTATTRRDDDRSSDRRR